MVTRLLARCEKAELYEKDDNILIFLDFEENQVLTLTKGKEVDEKEYGDAKADFKNAINNEDRSYIG